MMNRFVVSSITRSCFCSSVRSYKHPAALRVHDYTKHPEVVVSVNKSRYPLGVISIVELSDLYLILFGVNVEDLAVKNPAQLAETSDSIPITTKINLRLIFFQFSKSNKTLKYILPNYF